jgi:hypothetical protein
MERLLLGGPGSPARFRGLTAGMTNESGYGL